MINLRLIALASALALFLPAAAVALPSMWPTDDPTSLVIEGGAREYVNVSDVTLAHPQPKHVIEPNSTLGHEQLVEGHTVFATIDIKTKPVNDTGSVDITAALSCAAQTGWDGPRVLGVPLPYHIHTTTVQCLQNATLVAIPNPLYLGSWQASSLIPDGVVRAFSTPTGQTVYQTEYSYDISYVDADGIVHHETRYAWSASPANPWIDESGAVKSLYMSLPTDKLAQMGVRDFSIVDARTLDISQ